MPTRGPTMPQHPTRFPSRFACGHLFSFFHFSRLLRSTSTWKSTSTSVVAYKRRSGVYGESNDVSWIQKLMNIPFHYRYPGLRRKSRCDGCPRAIFPFDRRAYRLAAIRRNDRSKFVVRVPFFLISRGRRRLSMDGCANRRSYEQVEPKRRFSRVSVHTISQLS